MKTRKQVATEWSKTIKTNRRTTETYGAQKKLRVMEMTGGGCVMQ